MKTIYLQNLDYEWNKHQFSDITELIKIIVENNYHCELGYGCELGNGCELGDYTILRNNPLYIVGTKHFVVNYTNDKIQIGCRVESFTWWNEHYKAIGKLEDYSEDQIKEYKSYIDFIIAKYKN